MFETLMKFGGYRVDYINPEASGKPGSFGFYVRGELPNNFLYSRRAKHHLFAGLNVIQKEFDSESLVAIYIDISDSENLTRPAYAQMKRDMQAGMFRRVFAFTACDLVGDSIALIDLKQIYKEINGFELITYDDGVCKTLPLHSDKLMWVHAEERVCT